MSGTLYRKKPVVVEAMLYDGTEDSAKAIQQWAEGNVDLDHEDLMHYGSEEPTRVFTGLYIYTLEGSMYAAPGDQIIKGTRGEFYPCKPEAFEDTFEIVEEEPEHDYDWAVALQGEAVADMN